MRSWERSAGPRSGRSPNRVLRRPSDEIGACMPGCQPTEAASRAGCGEWSSFLSPQDLLPQRRDRPPRQRTHRHRHARPPHSHSIVQSAGRPCFTSAFSSTSEPHRQHYRHRSEASENKEDLGPDKIWVISPSIGGGPAPRWQDPATPGSRTLQYRHSILQSRPESPTMPCS